METLERLRQRLATIEDLDSIVRTMKALAAVGIRQQEAAVRSLADYYRAVELGLHVVLRDLPESGPEPSRGASAVGAVVFGSDHGLCGRFNEDIVAHARERLAEHAADARVRLLAVGARAAGLLEHAGVAVEENVFLPASVARIVATVRHVLLKIDEWRQQDVDRVYVFHQRPAHGERHRPTGTRLLPINLARFHGLDARPWPGPTLPAFTMDRGALLASLLRQYLFVSVFRACAESLLAENTSRLAAMQAAESNLAERHADLTAEFRRHRQEAITTELLDVVSGYEVLRKAPVG